jgi:hypothetical protein
VNERSTYPPDAGGHITDEIVTGPVRVVFASNHEFATEVQVKVDVVLGLKE